MEQEEAIKIANQYLEGRGYSNSKMTALDSQTNQKLFPPEQAYRDIFQPEAGSLEAGPYRVVDSGGFWSLVYREKEHPERGWQVAVEKESGKVIQPPAPTAFRPPGTKVTKEQAVAIAVAELILGKGKGASYSERQIKTRENSPGYRNIDRLKDHPSFSVLFLPYGNVRDGETEVVVDQETGEVIFVTSCC